ncbi:MAG: hypothetical protein HY394_00670 [Candidatus Diapherotrites archaeon]|nr:hypothetical protein [Candidatus Diapherotrites archaeon]
MAFAQIAFAATVHGEIFSWDALDHVTDAVITVDSVPEQRIVSSDGTYSFDLPAGDFIVRAELVRNNELVLFADENVSINADGNFRLDLIMFPPIGNHESDLLLPELDSGITNDTFSETDANSPAQGTPTVNEKGDSGNSATEQGQGQDNGFFLAAIVVAFLGVLAAGLMAFFRRGKKPAKSAETNAVPLQEKEKGGSENFDKYALEVLDVLRRSGNRLTQKELREKISSVGEAKISLIVSELEAAGKVKKIKQGRGNIIVLKE